MRRRAEETGGGLKLTVARTLDEVERMRPSWAFLQRAVPCPNYNADIDRYISVLESLDGRERPYVVLLSRGGEPVALCAARLGVLSFKLGAPYRTIFALKLNCLSVVHGGLLGSPEQAALESVWSELYEAVRRREADVVFFNHFPSGSPLVATANRAAGPLARGRFAVREPHWSMAMPASMESFYASLAAPTRQDLKRALRKVSRAGAIEHVFYPGGLQLDTALRAVEEISREAYQRALGTGFTGGAAQMSQLRAAAGHGWLRVHVLLLDGAPAAFEMAMEYSGTYFLYATAYRASLRPVAPGKALLLMLLEHLCERGGVERMDFGFGDADYKRIYCRECVDEVASYVFAPRLKAIAVNLMQAASGAASAVLRKALAPAGGTRRIKRRWRERLARGER